MDNTAKDDLDLLIEDMERHSATTGVKPLTREELLALLESFPGTPYVPHGPPGCCFGGVYS